MEYWARIHYSSTPLLQSLTGRPEVIHSFPLTRGGSVPTFYAFSGVETAGEQ